GALRRIRRAAPLLAGDLRPLAQQGRPEAQAAREGTPPALPGRRDPGLRAPRWGPARSDPRGGRGPAAGSAAIPPPPRVRGGDSARAAALFGRPLDRGHGFRLRLVRAGSG